MKRILTLLLAAAVVTAAIVLAERNLRLGRDLIFRSSDVVGFELPNGKAVRTNTWYDRSDLLTADQEFYTGVNGLGIMVPESGVSLGFATITDEGRAAKYLKAPKTHTTALSMKMDSGPASPGAATETKVEGYTEWWVCRQEADGPK